MIVRTEACPINVYNTSSSIALAFAYDHKGRLQIETKITVQEV